MESWSALTQSAVGPWWGSALIGFLGAIVGAGVTLLAGALSDWRKARHEDALQWDKEIVKLAQGLLTSTDRILRSRPSALQEASAEEVVAFNRLCNEEEANQDAILGQLELIAHPRVRVAGLELQSGCFDLVQKRYNVTSGVPERRRSTYLDVIDQRRLFVEEVRQAIRQ